MSYSTFVEYSVPQERRRWLDPYTLHILIYPKGLLSSYGFLPRSLGRQTRGRTAPVQPQSAQSTLHLQ
jgi:hypothetical protein